MLPCCQVSLIDGRYDVDQCAVFGNCASGCLWCLFFRLVCWITNHVLDIGDILHYVDDAFCSTFSDALSYYQPYNQSMPMPQARFLKLLDYIGLPNDDTKQQHGK